MRVAEFIREIGRAGWQARLRQGGHWELTHPNADGSVIMAATPSDHRWFENTRARMRRALSPVPKPERSAEPKVRRERVKSAPLRSWPEPIAIHRLPEPERREYPPEPPQHRLAGGPAGYRSCLDRA